MRRPRLEVADIFHRHGADWRRANAGHVSLGQLQVMAAIEQCRSAALGGHVERCEDCGHSRIAYNSCRNRHCPKCQGAAAQDWLAAREADLLPVGYFHVVFTLPAEIAPIAYQNKAVVYDLLFRTAAETLLTIAADPKHLGARIGATAVLHSWGSAMTHHPHVHMIVPGGGHIAQACPGAGVVSRKFSEEFGGRLIAEASQPGAIVVGDEGEQVGVTFGVIEKAAVVGGAVLRHAVEMLAEAAVEALDHAIGLRPERTGEAVGDGALRASLVKGMLTGGFVVRLGLFVDGKAVGEFGAVVGEHGVDLERKAVEETPEKAGGGGGPAIGQDLETDKAGGPVDGNIGVGAAAIERRQVFDIDVDEAGWRIGLKGNGRSFFGREATGDPVALQAPVNSAARQRGIDAAPHRLGDVVERQGEAAPQLDDQGFFPCVRLVLRRCGRVERSATFWRARQRATVRLWMPSSRASAALLAWLFWM